GEARDARLGNRERLGGSRKGVEPLAERPQLGPRLRPSREQLVVRAGVMPPFRVRDSVELALDLLETAGIRVEGGEERPRRTGRELVMPPARRLQFPPRLPGGAPPPQLLVAAVPVEHVELVGRSRQPPLLELARHRDQALGDRRDILASDAAPPCVRARPSV